MPQKGAKGDESGKPMDCGENVRKQATEEQRNSYPWEASQDGNCLKVAQQDTTGENPCIAAKRRRRTKKNGVYGLPQRGARQDYANRIAVIAPASQVTATSPHNAW